MNTFNALDDTFDITPTEVKLPQKKSRKEIIVSDKSTDREKDYQYQRAQLYDLVEKMQETLTDAMDTAQQTQHPRAYEVAFNGARHIADTVDKLGALHKSQKDLEIEEVKVQQTNTTNNVFMSGSTAELMRMLKDSQNK